MFSAGLLIVLCGKSLGKAELSHFPTNEDMRHIRSISDPQPSPDGHSVLFRLTETTADGAGAHLWLTDVDQNVSRQISYSPATDKSGEASGRWMPDGKSILFLAKRGEHRQIFQLPLNGGEAHPFEIKAVPPVDTSKAANAVPPKPAEAHSSSEAPAPLELNISSFDISPDGKTLAILAADPQTAGEQAQSSAKSDASWVDHDPHGTRLYLFSPDTGKTTPIAVPANAGGVNWSTDSARLFVTQSPVDGSEDLDYATTSWIVEASTGSVQRIAELPRDLFGSEWSSDGKGIWYFAQAKRDAPPFYGDLYRFDLASKKTQNYTDGFGGSLAGGMISLPDGGILANAGFGFSTELLKFAAGNTAAERVKFATPVVNSLATNNNRTAWVYVGSGSTQPPALYFTHSLAQPAKVLNTPSLFPSDLKTVASTTIRWKSDQFTIEGVLYLPAEAALHKVPLIVEVHGGPTGAFLDSYQPFANFLVGHGWAVLRTNPRGSTNYGAAFVAANKNDLGGGDYRDIMAGVDYVIKNEPIDGDRMALEGYSYGGEMAGFVEVKTSRFKAIVSGAPVIDQFSEYGTENGSQYDRWFYGKPWEHFTDAWRQSPIAGVKHAKTPFMLLQGQEDTTDPLGQSQEMYRALRQMGVPVELITYPRDDHGVLGGAIYGSPSREPWHGFDARQRIVEFIEKAFGQVKS